jgi:general secretion pathway protein M
VNAWWRRLGARDRRILAIGGFVVGALLFWALLWDPAMQARSSLRAQVQSAEASLAEMHVVRAQLQSLTAGGSASVFERGGRSLLALADGSAREARLAHALKRIEPVSTGRVNVWLEGAEFDQVSIWLERLQSAYGVRVDEYSVQRGDATGKVDGRLTLVEANG